MVNVSLDSLLPSPQQLLLSLLTITSIIGTFRTPSILYISAEVKTHLPLSHCSLKPSFVPLIEYTYYYTFPIFPAPSFHLYRAATHTFIHTYTHRLKLLFSTLPLISLCHHYFSDSCDGALIVL